MIFNDPTKVFIIAEAGINHNGDLRIAKNLIDAAIEAGCDAVKFQKRTPKLSLAPHLWNVERDTPWGERMSYLAYRERIELSIRSYVSLIKHAGDRIMLSASPWDIEAARDLFALGVPFIKLASASVTDTALIRQVASFKLPVIMSTGMSGFEEIESATQELRDVPELGLLACTSAYPAAIADLHLNRIRTLQYYFPRYAIGYSGHESGLWTTLCAAAMGAQIIERHLTLDRSMPGTDQAASVEPKGFKRLVQEIRNLEQARGSFQLGMQECEKSTAARLRP